MGQTYIGYIGLIRLTLEFLTLHTSTPYMFCTMPFNTSVPCFTKDHLQMTSTKGYAYCTMTSLTHSKCLTFFM